jgi:ribosomal protein S18 acetylase RimI-like enzyme
MIRMFLDGSPEYEDSAEPLGPADCEEIEALFATGDGGGTGFGSFQLKTGLFRGIREDGKLIAVGGVHVVSQTESVAGVGNIFTRPDARGRGLAQRVTSSVVAALRRAGIRTIGLNVEHTNAPAIRAYERVGFVRRFRYYEGVAERCVD